MLVRLVVVDTETTRLISKTKLHVGRLVVVDTDNKTDQ